MNEQEIINKRYIQFEEKLKALLSNTLLTHDDITIAVSHLFQKYFDRYKWTIRHFKNKSLFEFQIKFKTKVILKKQFQY